MARAAGLEPAAAATATEKKEPKVELVENNFFKF